ncbi:16S rRNA (guanine(527)-N(7))-methyltransferase RsmG [Pectinatus frisingensis]|uniref:16S rRNA (guanine(527)-N(7))-methyltransferase RsmG n=1 Tax=Pectinatus frisingensis TaxID=865 RepID=UPI0018C78169|nr:16S rRNA (guanine(527)-N(7))-methyltransferase RsmG [Pectinatus frisingensis]
MQFIEYMEKYAVEFGLELSDKQLKMFDIYYQLLVEWNEKINLTAITDPGEVAVKHMVDSLSVCDEKIINNSSKTIDVGTGAGFPGIPIKIMYPDMQLTLLDSLNKRVKFLQTVADKLDFRNIEIIHGRAEELGKQKNYREKYDVVFSRAVARMPVLCEYALPFVKIQGYFIALKGRQYEAEIAMAQNALKVLKASIDKIKSVKLPGLDDVRAIIYIKKTGKLPPMYPRKAGNPEKKPL